MSTTLERRSPSLESMSSASSAFSFDDNPGITPISPNVTVQNASQSVVSNFWTQAEQEDSLPESGRMGRATSPRDEHSKSFEAPQAPIEAYPMHERFCFPAENIYFLVEGVLYSVHRYFFERDSSSFAGQGLSKQEPMVLANVSTHDFDLFLSILYPTSFGVHPASTVEEWSGILYIADKWSFLSIRTLTIAQIAPIASAVDKIVFGRLYGINEWLAGAYQAVCTRPDALTLEEGRRLGVDDAIRINAIRQEFCFVRVSDSSSKLFKDDVESRFGLANQTEHSASRKSMKDVADRLKPDNTAQATSKKEEAARAAENERKKREREAADKKAKELEDRQHEAEMELKEDATKTAERMKMDQEAANKMAKDLEDKQREAEMKWKEQVAKASERMKMDQEAADKKAKGLEDKQREAEMKWKERKTWRSSNARQR
ncbi:hypothetical protein FIBSPDRAFT_176901 [Athelia psychrophila]|uniref:BTB domain-containing protein n=1 Tax=Athelia psychrophila TaxID=1759441 RepID=A0A166SN04_9AGAM|nr:hypothetical protein FIBSPDRAFT_176901 [Fibularhizoctonia sp. CBS 109695]